MIEGIVKKFKINRIAYLILRRFALNSTVGLNIKNSYEYLKAIRPDEGSSCITHRNITVRDDYDVDIIVPVYNAEKYLRQCVESVLNQETEFNIRIILIDDGSTDNSASICDSYNSYKNIKVIHQENKGHSGARNTGLDAAESKYIMFLDADDTIPKNAVQCLLECAYNYEAEIVNGGHWITDRYGHKLKRRYVKTGRLDPMNELRGYTCMKVFRSELFNNITFPEKYWYEDTVLNQIMFQGIKSAYGIKEPVYNYRRNPSGVTMSGRKDPRCIDTLWVTLRLFDDGKQLGLSLNKDYYIYMLRHIILSCRRVNKQPAKTQKAVFDVFADFMRKHFEEFLCTTDKYKDLEKAIKDRNYNLYKLYCILE